MPGARKARAGKGVNIAGIRNLVNTLLAGHAKRVNPRPIYRMPVRMNGDLPNGYINMSGDAGYKNAGSNTGSNTGSNAGVGKTAGSGRKRKSPRRKRVAKRR